MLSIDITDRQIKLVRGVHSGSKIRVQDADMRELSMGMVSNGYITDIPMVAAELNDIIKQKVIDANKAYREGNPILSDQEYDDLLESLKTSMSEDEYEAFVSTLNEGSIEKNIDGKVKHPFCLGSLDKLKAEEPEIVKKWIKENVKNMLSVSAKVDGISSRAEYRNGKLVSLTTRGDGCLSEDAIVEFEDGRKIPIGTVCKLKIDGKVKSMNIDTGEYEFKQIGFHSIKPHTDNWVKITLEDGRELKLTEDHKVYTKNRGWVEAKDLTNEDDVISE